jgi:hypothetical protein
MRVDKPDDNGERRRADDEQELSVKGPMGMGFSFKGSQMFPAILLFLLALGIGYMIYVHDSKGADRYHENIVALTRMATAVEKSDATQKVMIYVLTLDQKGREQLNLMKPRELQDMQR